MRNRAAFLFSLFGSLFESPSMSPEAIRHHQVTMRLNRVRGRRVSKGKGGRGITTKLYTPKKTIKTAKNELHLKRQAKRKTKRIRHHKKLLAVA